jgi:hypothetical protein
MPSNILNVYNVVTDRVSRVVNIMFLLYIRFYKNKLRISLVDTNESH